MQRLFLLLTTILTFSAATPVFAGNKTTTAHFTISGVCDQCKSRIEKAAYDVKGVRFANWNEDTRDITVKYDSSKTTPEVILKSIAKAGYDNEMFKAEEGDYDKLPKCCHYRSEIKKH